jgi:hypothetical protein
MRSVKVLIPSLLTGACTSLPLWTPRPGPLSSHNSRRDLLGTWSVEFIADTVDSFAGFQRGLRLVARHGVPATKIVGSLQLLDSLTADRVEIYARADRNFVNVLCNKRYQNEVIIMSVSRKNANVDLLIPPYLFMHAHSHNLFATARYYGDSVVGNWSQSCSTGVQVLGRLRMVRAGGI